MHLMLLLIAMTAGTTGQATVSNTANTVRLAEGATRPAAKATDLAWLAGRWQGEGLGGSVEETWSEPAGGAMVGHFRLVRDGKPVFYEIMTLLETEGSVEMRLKHLNPDMTSWEEKADFVTFKLVKLEPDAIYFNGLTFRRTAPDRIELYLALRNRADNSVREEKFTMTRVR